MPKYKFTLSKDRKSFQIDFEKTVLCNAVGKFEFHSRLLYQLRPNSNGIWEVSNQPRINAFIIGFPPEITWSRKDEKILSGCSDNQISDSFIAELKIAIQGIQGAQENEFTKREYVFSIKDKDSNTTFDYEFLGRSRSVSTLCVLWDGINHPRDNIEVRISEKIPNLARFSMDNNNQIVKTYGDPSKTVDELRNEGFPRKTDQSARGTYLQIAKNHSYGNIQEHYKLLKKTQSLADRVGRSRIPKKYRKKLYEASNYRCNNCGEKFPENYLSPDHRVPSIVQADNLSLDNFMDVLQTLCVRCNQKKRESCKKCPYDHQCKICGWAYPEKHGISTPNMKLLRETANKNKITVNQLIEKVIKKS